MRMLLPARSAGQRDASAVCIEQPISTMVLEKSHTSSTGDGGNKDGAEVGEAPG